MSGIIKHSVKKIANNQAERNIIVFWRPTDPNGYLGQWYQSNFTFDQNIFDNLPQQVKDLAIVKDRPAVITKLFEQKNFNTAEKFMMMSKSALFQDDEVFEVMGKTNDPKIQKSLGQKVKNFNQDTWNTYCRDIVKLGKLSQVQSKQSTSNETQSNR